MLTVPWPIKVVLHRLMYRCMKTTLVRRESGVIITILKKLIKIDYVRNLTPTFKNNKVFSPRFGALQNGTNTLTSK